MTITITQVPLWIVDPPSLIVGVSRPYFIGVLNKVEVSGRSSNIRFGYYDWKKIIVNATPPSKTKKSHYEYKLIWVNNDHCLRKQLRGAGHTPLGEVIAPLWESKCGKWKICKQLLQIINIVWKWLHGL